MLPNNSIFVCLRMEKVRNPCRGGSLSFYEAKYQSTHLETVLVVEYGYLHTGEVIIMPVPGILGRSLAFSPTGAVLAIG